MGQNGMPAGSPVMQLHEGLEVRELPAILIAWDEQAQLPVVQFGSQAFRTWDWILMLLEGARLLAEQKRRETMIQAMGQQQMANLLAQQQLQKGNIAPGR